MIRLFLRVDEDSVTILGFTFPMAGITLHGYEHIPTPPIPLAGLPATPTASTPPEDLPATPHPTTVPGAATKLSQEYWHNDSLLPQYFGRTVYVEGFIDSFNASRTVIWGPSGNGIYCYFPEGWAGENVELLETMRDDEAQVVATGKVSDPEEDPPPLGWSLLKWVRVDMGLRGCTLELRQ